jgi:thymidylate synthase
VPALPAFGGHLPRPAVQHCQLNHFDQAREQLQREPHALPSLRLNPDVRSLFDFRFEDVHIDGYVAHKAIKAPVAV